MLHQRLLGAGYHRRLQWMPSHSGIPGNDPAHAAPKLRLLTPAPSSSTSRTPGLTQHHRRRRQRHMYFLPYDHCQIGIINVFICLTRYLTYRAPRGLPRRVEGALHRVHLGVAYTTEFSRRIYSVA